MKAREFWIKRGFLDPKEGVCRIEAPTDYSSEYFMHIREVKPIDWGKLWIEYHKAQKSPLLQANREIIKQLVEKQLNGE